MTDQSRNSPRNLPDDVRIEIHLPALESLIELVRAVVGRTARLAGFSLDGIEDLALAVDEAVGILLSVARPARIVACLILETQRLIVDVTVAETGGLWNEARLDGTRYELLQTLCEKVEVMIGPVQGLRLVQSVR